MFSQLHPRYRTPWFTIVFYSILAGLLILSGQTALLGNLYSFGAMLSFTTAHVSVIALRIKGPDQERPYRMPWNVMIRGRDPDTAVLGAIGTFGAWIAVTVLHTEARTIGIPWMVDRDDRLLRLPPPPGPRSASLLQDRPARAPAGLRGARVPNGAGADLRR